MGSTSGARLGHDLINPAYHTTFTYPQGRMNYSGTMGVRESQEIIFACKYLLEGKLSELDMAAQVYSRCPPTSGLANLSLTHLPAPPMPLIHAKLYST